MGRAWDSQHVGSYQEATPTRTKSLTWGLGDRRQLVVILCFDDFQRGSMLPIMSVCFPSLLFNGFLHPSFWRSHKVSMQKTQL